MRSRRISGRRAYEWGIATECVADAELEAITDRLVEWRRDLGVSRRLARARLLPRLEHRRPGALPEAGHCRQPRILLRRRIRIGAGLRFPHRLRDLPLFPARAVRRLLPAHVARTAARVKLLTRCRLDWTTNNRRSPPVWRRSGRTRRLPSAITVVTEPCFSRREVLRENARAEPSRLRWSTLVYWTFAGHRPGCHDISL
jgi:hypothetical protein